MGSNTPETQIEKLIKIENPADLEVRLGFPSECGRTPCPGRPRWCRAVSRLRRAQETNKYDLEDGPAAGASGQLGRHGFHAQRGERRGTRALLGCFAAGAQTYVSLSWADEVARASAPPLNIRTTVTCTMAAGL